MDIVTLLVLYGIIGAYVTALFIDILKERRIDTNYILMSLPDKERDFLCDHPKVWNVAIGISVFVLMLIWPYVLYNLIKESE